MKFGYGERCTVPRKARARNSAMAVDILYCIKCNSLAQLWRGKGKIGLIAWSVSLYLYLVR